ncbi:MAG TPA: DUF5615 family PIN-like protein [Gammaproteobacteria bacterium]|nr:DUF5615 family PIN-like protein [Gammaproteobacteria bacterium]
MSRIRLLADENFNHRIVRGLIRRIPPLDVVSVQEVGLSGASDAEVLSWAATEQRIVLTHDVSTMSREAILRIEAGLSMPGVVECPRSIPIGAAIENLSLFAQCSIEGEWQDTILYLPF